MVDDEKRGAGMARDVHIGKDGINFVVALGHRPLPVRRTDHTPATPCTAKLEARQRSTMDRRAAGTSMSELGHLFARILAHPLTAALPNRLQRDQSRASAAIDPCNITIPGGMEWIRSPSRKPHRRNGCWRCGKKSTTRPLAKASIASQRMRYAISVWPTGTDARQSEITSSSLSIRALPRITMSWSIGTAHC